MSQKFIVAILFSVLGTGCFVDVDAPFSVERRCDRSASCTFRGIAAEQQDLVTLGLESGSVTIPIDLGSDDVVQAHYGEGPLSLDNSLTLDSLEIEPLDGVTLEGVEILDVVRGDGVMLATYQPGTVSSAGEHTLQLQGNPGVNLLELGPTFTLGFRGAGRMPAADWMANLILHAHVNARAESP
jgi:hypothetical protein